MIPFPNAEQNDEPPIDGAGHIAADGNTGSGDALNAGSHNNALLKYQKVP
jgi:hypothetical protein